MVAQRPQEDNQFRDLMFQYMELISNAEFDKDEERDIFDQLITMVEKHEVSPASVIRAVSDTLEKYPSYAAKLLILLLMNTITFISKMTGGHTYPEFFWLVIKFNILGEETEDLSNKMSPILEFSNSQAIRSYLTYSLIIKGDRIYPDLIRAFYYVGFTVESLRIVNEIVQYEHHQDLYILIYSDAMSMLFSKRASAMTEDEKTYLKSFFERGLTSSSSHIRESCSKALEQLEKI